MSMKVIFIDCCEKAISNDSVIIFVSNVKYSNPVYRQ